jgi:DNA-binding NarL/FixJ family response regulator
MGVNIVILEGDPRVAQRLAGKFSRYFQSVHVTRSGDELRHRVVESRPEVVVVDVEASRLTEVRSLHQDFPQMPIVCMHRIPDEELWIEAMDAGASDVCRSDEWQSVVTAVLRNVALAQGAVA